MVKGIDQSTEVVGSKPMYRRFCFTDFTCTDERLAEYRVRIPYSYILVGKETCPTTGRSHYQGYVELRVQTRGGMGHNGRTDADRRADHARVAEGEVQKVEGEKEEDPVGPRATKNGILGMIEGWHIEVCKGSSKSNITYCKKEGNVVLEDGEPREQGERVDLPVMKKIAYERGMAAVCEVGNYQHMRMAEKYLTYCEKERDFEPRVVWLFGESGVGKSRAARDLGSGTRVYVKNQGGHWYDGYDGHETLILDDWRDSWWAITTTLSLLDRYPFRVEFKGGHRQMLARLIVVTSPFPPWEVYQGAKEENKKQLVRRVGEVYNIKEDVVIKMCQ